MKLKDLNEATRLMKNYRGADDWEVCVEHDCIYVNTPDEGIEDREVTAACLEELGWRFDPDHPGWIFDL